MKDDTKAPVKIKLISKRKYATPTLTRYGALAEITGGGTSGSTERTPGQEKSRRP